MTNTTIFKELDRGTLDIGNGYKFRWMESADEIYGYIDDNGDVLYNSDGWYRTNNPQLAAFRAVNAMDLPLIRTV